MKMPSDNPTTTDPKDAEIVQLRALVTRLTDKLEDFVRDHDDPGADALACIFCGRHFIYG